MSNLMTEAVISMPFELAMADDLSRRQFYDRAQLLLAEVKQSKWLPIEQAPKDVVSLLLALPGGDVVTGSFNPFYELWYSHRAGKIEPTHFQYLPQPPEGV